MPGRYEIPLGATLEIAVRIGTTRIVTDNHAVTDSDGDAVDLTGVEWAALLKRRPGDADEDAVGEIGVEADASSICTYTFDDALTALLDAGQRYYCTVIATMPEDHAVEAYQQEPFEVRAIEIVAHD